MKPTSGAFTMPRLSQACLLGYTPPPQQAFQGDAAHQAQRRTWLTPKDSPGTWYTRRDYRSRWTLRPFHRTVFTAHTWSALPSHNRSLQWSYSGGRLSVLYNVFISRCALTARERTGIGGGEELEGKIFASRWAWGRGCLS